jgi:hypothetical protein
MVVGFTTTCAISTANVVCSNPAHALDFTLCNKGCQCLAAGRWFSPRTPVSSTYKTYRQNVTEILLKGVLNTINLTIQLRKIDLLLHILRCTYASDHYSILFNSLHGHCIFLKWSLHYAIHVNERELIILLSQTIYKIVISSSKSDTFQSSWLQCFLPLGYVWQLKYEQVCDNSMINSRSFTWIA